MALIVKINRLSARIADPARMFRFRNILTQAMVELDEKKREKLLGEFLALVTGGAGGGKLGPVVVLRTVAGHVTYSDLPAPGTADHTQFIHAMTARIM